jgi:hypothetical protein
MELKVTWYPEEELNKPGTYEIRDVILSFEPDRQLILILAQSRRRASIPYPHETFEDTDLVRLIKAFGDETEGWIGKNIRVTSDSDGKRRIDPLTTDESRRRAKK